MDDGDVAVLLDERREVDGTVLRVKALAVPESEKFPTGIKYRFHYGTKHGETLVRYDNAHGPHERHTPKTGSDQLSGATDALSAVQTEGRTA